MKTFKHQKGFTLIELMLSITVGMIVFGGVFTTFNNQKLLYKRQEKIIKINQDSRAALNVIKNYVNMAGISVPNCSNDNAANICTGVVSLTTSSFTITSDLNLDGKVIPSPTISNGQEEEITFLENDGTLYICPGRNFDEAVCQFILDNVEKFEVQGCRLTTDNQSVECLDAPDPRTVTSLQVTLQGKSPEDITELDNSNSPSSILGSEITTRVFFINKTFQ